MVNEKSSAVGVNIQEKATMIWNVADVLRGPFKPHEYGLVILPMTVVKRFHGVSKLHRKLHQAAARRQAGVTGDIAGCAEALSEAERERPDQGASEVWFRTVRHHHQPPPRHLPSGNGGCPPRAYHRQESHRGRDGAKGKPCAETCPDRQRTGHISGRRAGRQDMG